MPLIQLVVQLSTSASHLSDALNSSALDVKSMRVAQVNAARATARLAGTLQQMNANVISALVEINTTAIRVNQTIGNGLNPFHPDLVSLVGATIIYCKGENTAPLLRCSD
jgi:fumarate hydratase class II